MQRLLTPLELKVMNLLWVQKKAFVKDLLKDWQEPQKPAYNTVSTTIRILEEKGYVDHESFGRTHQYYPVISKKKYQKRLLRNIVENVFSGSVSNLISTMVDQGNLSKSELEDLKKLVNNSSTP